MQGALENISKIQAELHLPPASPGVGQVREKLDRALAGLKEFANRDGQAAPSATFAIDQIRNTLVDLAALSAPVGRNPLQLFVELVGEAQKIFGEPPLQAPELERAIARRGGLASLPQALADVRRGRPAPVSIRLEPSALIESIEKLLRRQEARLLEETILLAQSQMQSLKEEVGQTRFLRDPHSTLAYDHVLHEYGRALARLKQDDFDGARNLFLKIYQGHHQGALLEYSHHLDRKKVEALTLGVAIIVGSGFLGAAAGAALVGNGLAFGSAPWLASVGVSGTTFWASRHFGEALVNGNLPPWFRRFDSGSAGYDPGTGAKHLTLDLLMTNGMMLFLGASAGAYRSFWSAAPLRESWASAAYHGGALGQEYAAFSAWDALSLSVESLALEGRSPEEESWRQFLAPEAWIERALFLGALKMGQGLGRGLVEAGIPDSIRLSFATSPFDKTTREAPPSLSPPFAFIMLGPLSQNLLRLGKHLHARYREFHREKVRLLVERYLEGELNWALQSKLFDLAEMRPEDFEGMKAALRNGKGPGLLLLDRLEGVGGLGKFAKLRAAGIQGIEELPLALQYIQQVAPRYGKSLMAGFQADRVDFRLNRHIQENRLLDEPDRILDPGKAGAQITLARGSSVPDLVQILTHLIPPESQPEPLRRYLADFPRPRIDPKAPRAELQNQLLETVLYDEARALASKFLFFQEARTKDYALRLKNRDQVFHESFLLDNFSDLLDKVHSQPGSWILNSERYFRRFSKNAANAEQGELFPDSAEGADQRDTPVEFRYSFARSKARTVSWEQFESAFERQPAYCPAHDTRSPWRIRQETDRHWILQAKRLGYNARSVEEAVDFLDRSAQHHGFEGLEHFLFREYGYTAASLLPAEFRRLSLPEGEPLESGAAGRQAQFIDGRVEDLREALIHDGMPPAESRGLAIAMANQEWLHPEWAGILQAGDFRKSGADFRFDPVGERGKRLAWLALKARRNPFPELLLSPGMPEAQVLRELRTFLPKYREAQVRSLAETTQQRPSDPAESAAYLLKTLGFEVLTAPALKVPASRAGRLPDLNLLRRLALQTGFSVFEVAEHMSRDPSLPLDEIAVRTRAKMFRQAILKLGIQEHELSPWRATRPVKLAAFRIGKNFHAIDFSQDPSKLEMSPPLLLSESELSKQGLILEKPLERTFRSSTPVEAAGFLTKLHEARAFVTRRWLDLPKL